MEVRVTLAQVRHTHRHAHPLCKYKKHCRQPQLHPLTHTGQIPPAGSSGSSHGEMEQVSHRALGAPHHSSSSLACPPHNYSYNRTSRLCVLDDKKHVSQCYASIHQSEEEFWKMALRFCQGYLWNGPSQRTDHKVLLSGHYILVAFLMATLQNVVILTSSSSHIKIQIFYYRFFKKLFIIHYLLCCYV